MVDPLPFYVSAEVEKWLLAIPLRPDTQPGFSCAARFAVYRGAELVEEFVGEHYSIAHASLETWDSLVAIQVAIGARAFWIPKDTLDKLRGKMLKVIHTNVSKQEEPKIRSFLVAA
jgi:hypothetical protein